MTIKSGSETQNPEDRIRLETLEISDHNIWGKIISFYIPKQLYFIANRNKESWGFSLVFFILSFDSRVHVINARICKYGSDPNNRVQKNSTVEATAEFESKLSDFSVRRPMGIEFQSVRDEPCDVIDFDGRVRVCTWQGVLYSYSCVS